MVSVAILLSTYNGEKFLREQLDSLLAQSGVEVEVFVRDDGSSDGTAAILSEYAKNCANFHFELAKNAGVGNSFMNLLYSVPDSFDYYAFSDQDDIWENEKLCEAVKLLEKSGACLYASNQECVDWDGNSLGLRYGNDSRIHTEPAAVLSRNTLAGCTMVLTRRLKILLSEEGRRPSENLLKNRIHDVWLAMTASLNGGIVYDERSYIKYRQHGNNVVGAYEGGFKKKLKQRMKKLFHSEYRNGRSMLAKEICEKFPESTADYPIVEICSRAKSFSGKIKILKNGKKLRSFTGEGSTGFFLKVMFGFF